MSASLPRSPNLQHLKKQAKQLLAAQRHGVTRCCPLLRRLHRFSEATDEEILAARVTLAETQLVLAMHYGFRSWSELREEVKSHPPADEYSLDAVMARAEEDIPEYGGAGVPLGVVAALNHAGVSIGYMEFAAASGWAFSFGYRYDDISPAYMAVRGRPDRDGPFEVFSFLPRMLGFGYEMALTQDPDAVWEFVQRHADAGTPVMSEHLDGGLITAYRTSRGRRQIFFDGTVMPGWTDVDKLNPYAVYVLVKEREPEPRDRIRHRALERALAKGEAHEYEGVPQGMAALQRYHADVADATKDFPDTSEWFCWAGFERLMARRCCEVWLRSVVDEMEGEASKLLSQAADRFGEAFRWYDRFGYELDVGKPIPPRPDQVARPPERATAIAAPLGKGIAAEAEGRSALAAALAAMD